MPTIAFWNLARQNRPEMLAELIDRRGIEILAVAEQAFEPAELIVAYSTRTGRSLYEPRILSSRVRFYSVFPENLYRSVADDPHLSIKEYKPLVGDSVLIVGVHLPSKQRQTDEEQAFNAQRIAARIKEAEQLVGHDRTMVLGDFNMDPFDAGMVNGDGFHAVMDRRVAAKGSRRILDQERSFFYNPMWKLMGDHSAGALGTFYRNRGGFVNYFWHTFDQVLLRPSLLAAFREEELSIVESIGSASLLATNEPGINARFSDHLPVLLNLHT